ncbi:hypothetical protein V5O48_017665 [Marasmius crinis-equi]|uniref:Hydrophobin n=1 Tax=Marasmius crinis-equi TaxID=585013 RepID=A0ABR3ENC2_9AGAR
MLFNKFFALSAMTTLAAATAVVKRTGGGEGGGSCTSGLQCCDSTTTASDPTAAALLTTLGIVLQDLNVVVGLTCSPITVVGGGNGACSKTTVYCEDNSHSKYLTLASIEVLERVLISFHRPQITSSPLAVSPSLSKWDPNLVLNAGLVDAFGYRLQEF